MIAGQGKYVASIDVDHSGSRVASGSRDYSVRLFDFNGMKSDLRSFRKIEPFDGHPVHAVSWSPSGNAQITHQVRASSRHTQGAIGDVQTALTACLLTAKCADCQAGTRGLPSNHTAPL